ncbi:major capsid protein [Solibacillus sp. A46]|uniref:Major capsid protein n=1 Tax=Solibacillus faecavium TaxID=2762221 RepID=A0ABR8XYR9_9BACL|nr:major capsid protein [Solibacillus faecavium]MBD8037096.1 major capsid protein [Solibacillus faecavium]
MPDVLEMFNQKTVLNYLKQRKLTPFVGEELFPENKYDTLEFEYLVGASNLPVAAKIHAFDTEAEIGSIEAGNQALEAAYIKKKYQIKEKDLIALQFPRTPQEQQMLVGRVFNLVERAVGDVRAEKEIMRMQALANGELSLPMEGGGELKVNYNVPDDNKEALAGAATWDSPDADIVGDITRAVNALDEKPTRALTSTKIVSLILRNSKIIAALFGKDSGRVATLADLNAFMQSHGLPSIATYDSKYRVQNADGTYTTHRYFPENKFVMFGDVELGETLLGPTPEESRLLRQGNEDVQNIGKVIAMVYEEGLDPVSTWVKAAATAIPSFPEANNVFQLQPIA